MELYHPFPNCLAYSIKLLLLKAQMGIPTKIIYTLFFFSGTAGLIYEIIWGRLLVLIFGSTTNSIVAVISAFLGGLAIGSLIAGKFADKLSSKQLIRTYSFLEIGVGLTGASTLILLWGVRLIYAVFSDGSSVTLSLLLVKFALTILVLLIPTILMGATLPILIKFAEKENKSIGKSVSFLYATNTLGGVLGVILSAFVLIELFGLRNSLLIASAVNLLIGLTARFIKPISKAVKEKEGEGLTFSNVLSKKTLFIIFAFSLSGLISIAYEVLWTRILTPTLGTFIYAFAAVLAIYIFGIGLGSLMYEKFFRLVKTKSLAFGLCELGIGFFALTSVILAHKFVIDTYWRVAAMILPATIMMGLTFPVVVSLVAKEKSLGKVIGLSYFGNTIGAIAGGFIASFFLIPIFGSSQSIAVLSIINFAIAAAFLYLEKESHSFLKSFALILTLFLIGANSYLVISKSNRLYQKTNDFNIIQSQLRGDSYAFKEDEVASVFGFRTGKNDDLGLYIDGVATTSRVAETRLMAQIPITLHKDPHKVLVIAFGMGTTFRSSLKQGMETDAVELVPSVPAFMHFYHDNAPQVLSDPRGKIIINDGRNYAFLTRKKYDIVAIDPPPPFNAAGTSVLHSKEFYQDLSKHLNQDGIVAQWIYYNGSSKNDIGMAIKSFLDVFPYVLALQKTGSVGGLFLEGSYSPIAKERLDSFFQNDATVQDLAEILKVDSESDMSKAITVEVVGDRDSLMKEFSKNPPITDDRPRNEYFILRKKFAPSQILADQTSFDFVEKLKADYRSSLK